MTIEMTIQQTLSDGFCSYQNDFWVNSIVMLLNVENSVILIIIVLAATRETRLHIS